MCDQPHAGPFNLERDQPLIELLAGLLGNILVRERAEDLERRRAERAEAEAFVDALTGLTNRGGWERLVAKEEERCARYGDPATVVVVDLDTLKFVNDTLGHGAGDDLLRAAAAALRRCARESDLVARIGGDEFAVLLLSGVTEVDHIVERVRSELDASGILASVGASARHPEWGLVQAFHEADLKMLEEKRARRLVRGAA